MILYIALGVLYVLYALYIDKNDILEEISQHELFNNTSIETIGMILFVSLAIALSAIALAWPLFAVRRIYRYFTEDEQ